jgi:glycosyltransferase involved in cell wall biosynthesis
MNVVMFSDAYWPRVNGVTVSVDTFSRALIKAGHRVMVVCSEYPQEKMTESIAALDPHVMLEPGGASSAARGEYAPELLRVPSGGVFFSKEDRAAKLSDWPRVEELIRAFAPDVLHINTEFIIADFGFRYGKKHRVPIVYTFHTIWEDYAANYFPLVPDFLLRFIVRKFQRGLLKKSDVIIVPTVQIAEMIRMYKVKKETRLLPTGVDPALFSHSPEQIAAFRKQLEEKYPSIEGKRILMFAGRVAKEKNISFVIMLMKELIERHPDLVLLIAGNGPDLEYYREEAAACGVGGHCVFTGYLERSEIALCYAVSKVFVFPSLTETQGLVTIEAMLSGVPVVAIGVLGTVEVMGGDNGGFMTGNDREEFKARLLQLLEDDELYRAKSAEARRHAGRWALDAITGKLVAVYREAPALMGRAR